MDERLGERREHPVRAVYIPGVAQMLVSMRESLGVPAKALAESLGTTEAEVIRDETEGYPRLTVERARRIMAALERSSK